jgi:hypothetical protein
MHVADRIKIGAGVASEHGSYAIMLTCTVGSTLTAATNVINQTQHRRCQHCLERWQLLQEVLLLQQHCLAFTYQSMTVYAHSVRMQAAVQHAVTLLCAAVLLLPLLSRTLLHDCSNATLAAVLLLLLLLLPGCTHPMSHSVRPRIYCTN